eukprot:s387_g24.t1
MFHQRWRFRIAMGCGANAIHASHGEDYNATHGREEVNVVVNTLAGRNICSLRVKPETSVRELKHAIHREGGPPVVFQVLTCATGSLGDDETCDGLGWHGDVCLCVLSKCLNVDQHLQSLSQSPGAFGLGLESSDLIDILTMGEDLLSQEPSLLELKGPITLCGAILGDLHHLQNLRHVVAAQPGTRLLFLGNYLAEKAEDVEVLILLLLLKIKYPDRIWLLRGAQEFGNSSHFRTECIRRYNLKVALRFLRILEWLPLAAVVEQTQLCCLGGIRPIGSLNLKEIQKLGLEHVAAMSVDDLFRRYN